MSSISRSIEISAPPQTVLGIILDVEAYPDWQREVHSVEVHATDDQGRPQQTTVTIRAVGQRGSYTVQYEYPSAEVVAYHLVGGDMMTRHDATFAVSDKGGGRTQFTVDMDLALVWPLPRLLVDQLIRKGVTDMLKRVKAQAEAA